MSEFEDDDIDKMFEEMISSDDLEQIKSSHINAIINIEKTSKEMVIKELVFITQSLAQSILQINELILNYMTVKDYDIDDEVREILGTIYKLSEDFDEYMIELLIEESELIEDESNGEEGESEDE